MKLREKLKHALALCGYPPPCVSSSHRKIGTGAWHDAYLVTVEGRVGYVSSGDAGTRHQLRLEYFFYLLRFAHRWWEILNSEPNEETYLRNGTPAQLESRLRFCLGELEGYKLN